MNKTSDTWLMTDQRPERKIKEEEGNSAETSKRTLKYTRSCTVKKT